MMRLLAFALFAAAAPVLAEPLTVRTGETWFFTIDHGQPADAHKAEAIEKPPPGQVKVTVRALFGTMMTITNNSPRGYNFQAQLMGAEGKAVTVRACTLPPNSQPAVESWPQKAAAVRLSDFKPAKGGRC
jgi:hypothetical protein